MSPVNGVAFNTAFSNNGTTDLGYGATNAGWLTGAGDFVSEMGYMFYADLGRSRNLRAERLWLVKLLHLASRLQPFLQHLPLRESSS